MRRAYLPLASSLISSLVLVAVALSFVLVEDPEASWGPWPLVVVAAMLAGGLGAEAVGYRVPPVPPGADPVTASARARTHWQTAALTRFALCEAPFFVVIALAVVVPTPQPALLVGLAAALGVVTTTFHLWPWSRPVNKVADALEAAGGRTDLREQPGSATAL